MLMPLGFVVLVSMVKDIFEDLKRHNSDKMENNRKVLVGDIISNTFVEKKWAELHVGQIVKIKCDDFFPADIVLLNSSAHKGISYIETKNLDGETNLKHKQALKQTIELTSVPDKILSNLEGALVECESPNAMLFKFEGTVTSSKGIIPLTVDQMLLRGSSLRNTDFIIGLVIFTGHETKIMKNSSGSRTKFSKLERATNKYILVIVLIQFVISFIGAMINTIWEVIYSDDF